MNPQQILPLPRIVFGVDIRTRQKYSPIMIIKTPQGIPFEIDEEDVFILQEYPFYKMGHDGYIVCKKSPSCGGFWFRLHRLIMNAPKDKVVDHINRNKWDNRKSNLRICTKAENNWNKTLNKKLNATSKYRGVKWHKKDCCWQASIQVKKKIMWLGAFSSEEKAAERYDDAAAHFYGEFAVLNFPDRPTDTYKPLKRLKTYSNHKGISFDKSKKSKAWTACFQKNGKRWSERFDTEAEALAKLKEAKNFFESFKVLPDPPEKKPKYSKYQGITFDKRRKAKPWKAKIKKGNRLIWQSNFSTEQEAFEALKNKELPQVIIKI